MQNSQVKTTRVNIRATSHQKNIITQAARINQPTISSFVIKKAYEADQQILAEESHFSLSPDDWRAFCDALDKPPKSLPALQKLLVETDVFDER